MSPRNSWKLGGKSLQVKIALSPASFSYPGLVTVNTCLLALLAIAPIRVTECCPQSHRTGDEAGGTCFGCPSSQTEVLCRCRPGAGLGFDKRALSPAQTAPSEGFIVGCARQSNRELCCTESFKFSHFLKEYVQWQSIKMCRCCW